MIFSYNWLQSFFEKKIPAPEKIAEVLTMRSFEVKGLKNISLPSGSEDTVLDIDVLPNRTHDCFSHFGVAKEISALFNIPLKPEEKTKFETVKAKAEDFLKLEVREPELCRRYIAGIILGVKVGPSPKWLEERLISVGQKPINNIVDAANYVMFDLGQPLHAFDIDKIKPVHIIVRRAVKGEKITTLDNKEFILDKDVLVIADSRDPLAIAGIKGGKKAEIDKKTANIILESANFDSVNIRLTSQKLGLKTGASVGFENEISPVLALKAIERLTSLICEIAGGKRVAERIDFYSKKIRTPKISFKASDVSKLIGETVPEKEISAILNRLGFEVKKAKGIFIATGPGERLDLVLKEDIIEEIARLYGYQKISSRIPEGILTPAQRNDNFFYENMARDSLVNAGFSEVYNYSFSPTGEIGVENPIAIDKKYLRMNLWNGLIINAAQNLKYFDEIRIFEIGKVFGRVGETVIEKNKLAGIVVLEKTKEKEQFHEIKGLLETLFMQLGINDFWLDDTPTSEGPETLVKIRVGQEIIGHVYHHNVFELDLEKLIELATEEIEYRPVSKYPAVIRDIAVLVPFETKMTNVTDIIENTGGELLIDSDLFDVYESEELGESRKSLAFHLIFQSPVKTLSDKEVNALMERIIKAVESVEDWEVRK